MTTCQFTLARRLSSDEQVQADGGKQLKKNKKGGRRMNMIPMNDEQAETTRRRIETNFEQLGKQLDLDGRAFANFAGTHAVFTDHQGHQHTFHFAPTVSDDERPWLIDQILHNRM